MTPEQHPWYQHRAGIIAGGLLRFRIPEHMHEGIAAYLLQGRPTGGFLESVLVGDGFDAARRADRLNQEALGRWFAFLITCAPAGAVHSQARVDAWIAHQGLLGVVREAMAAGDGATT